MEVSAGYIKPGPCQGNFRSYGRWPSTRKSGISPPTEETPVRFDSTVPRLSLSPMISRCIQIDRNYIKIGSSSAYQGCPSLAADFLPVQCRVLRCSGPDKGLDLINRWISQVASVRAGILKSRGAIRYRHIHACSRVSWDRPLTPLLLGNSFSTCFCFSTLCVSIFSPGAQSPLP